MLIDIERDNKVNICALSNGKQIMLVRTRNKFTNVDYVLLYPSKTNPFDYNDKYLERFESGEMDDPKRHNSFLLSREGTDYKREISKLDFNLKYVAEVEYLEIDIRDKSKLQRFFGELYLRKLFPYWHVEYGPVKLLKNASSHAYIALYRVYEVNVLDTDQFQIYTSGMSPPKMINGEEYIRTQVSDSKNLVPVLDSNSYLSRKNDIIEVAKRDGVYVDSKYTRLLHHSDKVMDAIEKYGESKANSFNSKKQIILYGPPGTGKTYQTKKIALEITLNTKKAHSENKGITERRLPVFETFKEWLIKYPSDKLIYTKPQKKPYNVTFENNKFVFTPLSDDSKGSRYEPVHSLEKVFKKFIERKDEITSPYKNDSFNVSYILPLIEIFIKETKTSIER